jgi:hypothetical protein
MRPRAFFTFILLNIAITALTAFAVISLMGPIEPAQDGPVPFATVLLIITATPDPLSTETVRIVTTTPQPGQIASIPTGVLDGTASSAGSTTESGGNPALPTATFTLDPEVAANSELQSTAQALPPGCILHVLAEGESPGALALVYETSVFDILAVNGLTEDDARFLQIGEILVIPLEGCELITPLDLNGDTEDPDATDTAGSTPEAPDFTAEPTLTPTVTLAPTAANAQIVIQEVVGSGDITRESVILFNQGASVNLTGWTLKDLDGNIYTLPETRLFNDSIVEIATRVGQNTPALKFWGLTRPVWGDSGDVITLSDASGVVQATLRLPAP